MSNEKPITPADLADALRALSNAYGMPGEPMAHDLLARWDAQGGDVALVEALASSGERGAALASVSGALADAGVAVGAAMEFGLDVRALAAERDAALARAEAAEAEVGRLRSVVEAVRDYMNDGACVFCGKGFV